MKKVIFIILLCGFLFRFLLNFPVFFNITRAYTCDSPRYERLSINLFKRGKFCAAPITEEILKKQVPEHLKKDLPGGHPPEIYRTPLYPLFLGIIYTIFGYDSKIAIIIQMLISVLTCYFLFLAFKEEPKIALIVLIISIFNLRDVIHSGQIMTETLFTFLFSVFNFLILKLWQNPNLKYSILSGLILCCMIYLRGEIGLLITLIFLPSFILLLRKFPSAKILTIISIPLISSLFWFIRNKRVYDVFDLSSIDDFNSVFFVAPSLISKIENISPHEARLKILEQKLNSPEICSLYSHLKENKNYFWRYVERINLLKKLTPIVYRYYSLHPFKTLEYYFTSIFWSINAGLGEWKAVYSFNEIYKKKLLKLISKAKTAFIKLKFLSFFKITLKILKNLPAGICILFFFLLFYSIFVFVIFVLGCFFGFKQNPFYFIFVILAVILNAFVSGPAAQARHFSVVYPLMISAGGFFFKRLFSQKR